MRSRNGLSENCVKAMIQDRWGFMWIGTKSGLNRYDGLSFKHVDVADPASGHRNNNVSSLCEDDDSQLWIGTDKGVFVMNPYTEKVKFFNIKTSGGEGISNWIGQIINDHHGNIWIVSPEEGAFRYNVKQHRLFLYRPSGHKSAANNPSCIVLRKNGELWLGTNGAGLYRYDYTVNRLEHHLLCGNGKSLDGMNLYALSDYGDWIAMADHLGKLVKYNPKTRTLIEVQAPSVHYKILRALCYDGTDLFVGTQDGLYVVNESKGYVRNIRENDLQPDGLSDNMISSLYRDRDNGIWIGTMQSGINYLSRRGLHFHIFVPLHEPGSLSSKRIREMVRVPDGNLWIANEEGRIDICNPITMTFQTISTPTYKQGTNRLALMVNGQQVWSGLFKHGLDVIDIASHHVTHFGPDELGLLPESSVFALLKDRQGRIWLGTENGLYFRDYDMHFKRVSRLPNIFCQDLVQDHRGNVWIATIGFGVYCYNPQSGSVRHYSTDNGLSSNDVSSITIDSQSRIWLSTDRGGLCLLNGSNGSVKVFSKEDGLPDDIVYKVLEDRNHYLWFGTNQGLVRFYLGKDVLPHIKVFQNSISLQGNQYNYKSAISSPNGWFFFGGSSGLVAFIPDSASSNYSNRPVYVTNLRVNGHEVPVGKDGILEQSIIHSREIFLPYDFSSFSLDISSLDFSGPEATNCEYLLSGVNDTWTPVPFSGTISFSRLQPGHYTLKLRRADSPADITELSIVVRHPWWSSAIAKAIYGMLLLAATWLCFRYVQRRQKRHLEHSQQKLLEERDRELLKLKIDFFTDVTHEIRTPLTLINGSVESLQNINEKDPTVRRNLDAIRKNCRRLLSLVNQLLDFRKMDTRSMSLSYTQTDVCQLVKEVMERFEPSISSMHKTISLDTAEDSIVIPVDREALTKIISNLLSNARKYSETFIQVMVERLDDCVRICVQNDGERIPEDKADEIFKPFTRLANSNSGDTVGSGIGLPLARSLAELHHGSLKLDLDSEYISFVLCLPLTQQQVIALSDQQQDMVATQLDDLAVDSYSTASSDGRACLLLAEDNHEVMDMLVEHLRNTYTLFTAYDGQQALSIIDREHIDIVVSDVMMPIIDGLELTRRIKDNQAINHIPVILLTAKQGLSNRLEGLRAGADAYIEKPFSFAHLSAQIDSLLNRRMRERESYLHNPYLSVESSAVSKADEDFLNRISRIIIDNIDDNDFTVERLAEEMCMSRSSLHRKIKEVTQMTPIDFIRLIKLKRAAELIRDEDYRTAEVCEKIGFTSQSYFIKLFQRQFGMTPKEFASMERPGKQQS